MEPSQSGLSWNTLLFRFLFAYILLYGFAFPFYYIPGAHTLIHPIGSALQDLALWYGKIAWGVDAVPT